MAHIKTYARLKPSKRPYPGYEIHNNNCLKVYIPDNKDFLTDPQQMIRSSLSYEVKFTEIFKPEASQEQVFDVAARDIIQSFLNGYNGTLFAYGQTGTGKTYTVEGNPTLHSSRGLCTRALSMIYEQLEKRRDDLVYVHLSYMEVYQEVVYDLLNPVTNPSISLIPFAKVTVYEGPRDSCILRGLTLHKAVNEEIAQMFLLQGQTNRKIAETPVNQRSSRSHAVFTVYLQIHKHDSQVVLNSKLHLVDLAGSERVSKTGVDGQQLTEAKSINLSLHHLETVIIALQSERSSVCSMEDRSKEEMSLLHIRSNTSFTSGPSSDSFNRSSGYVPYRNSLLTMILKDSLGGNCLTAMIATISMEPENVGESISTCRFAQRVARVSNNARRNEAVDDKTLIKQLKRKVVSLKHQLAGLQSRLYGKNPSVQRFHDTQSSALTAKDKAVCAQIMHDYLHGTIQNPLDAGICERSQFIECLNVLKQHCLHSRTMAGQPDSVQQHLVRPHMIDIGMFSDTFHKLSDLNTQDYSDSGSYSMILCPQCPTELTASDISLDNSDEYYSASDNQALANADGQSMGPFFKLHGGNHARKSSEKMTSWASKRSNRNRNLTTSQKAFSAKTDIPADTKDRYLQRLHQLESTYRQRLHRLEEDHMNQQSILYSLKRSRADSQQLADAQFAEQQLLGSQAIVQDKLNKILEKKRQFFAAYPSEKPKSLAAKRPCPKSTYETMSSPKQTRDSKQAGTVMSKGCDMDHHKKESKSEKLSTRPKKFTFKDAASLGRDLRRAQHKLKIASDHPARAQKMTSQPPVRTIKKTPQTAAEREEVTASTELASPVMGPDLYPPRTPSLDHLPERSPPHQLGCCSQQTLSKEESFSETSQSTEKQVKPIEDYMVQDDLHEGDHAKDNNSRSMKHN